MTGSFQQFRLLADKCFCPHAEREQLVPTGWLERNGEAPVRTFLRGLRDEIIFEAPDLEAAWELCMHFPALLIAVGKHAENKCNLELQVKVGPGIWKTFHKL